MRELSVLSFRPVSRPFRDEWDHDFPDLKFGIVNVRLFRDSEAYAEFKRRASVFSSQSGARLFETVELVYSSDDLQNAELLRMSFVGDAGRGGNYHAAVYDRRVECEACGWEIDVQVRGVVIDKLELRWAPDTAYIRQTDFYRTAYGELLLSSRARHVVEANATGVVFGHVYDIHDLDNPLSNLFHIRDLPKIRPKIPPTRIAFEDLCPHTNRYRSVYFGAIPGEAGSEYTFESSELGPAIAFTQEAYGTAPRYRPLVFVRQSMIRAFSEAKLVGFDLQPARIE